MNATRRLTLVVLALLLRVIAPDVGHSAVTLYDAVLGTLPDAQGWTLGEDISPPTAYVKGVDANGCHLSTLAFGTNDPPNFGGGVWWSRDGLGIDFAQNYWVEASIQILSAPNHSVNRETGWPRPGYTLTVYDVNGHLFWVGFGSTEVFLSNDGYGQYGSPNTVTASFVTTDRHHTYRLQRAPGGVGAELLADGASLLLLPALGPVQGSETLYFGDPTYWANSESYTAWVRYETPATVGVEPQRPETSLQVRPVRNPSSLLRVGFASPMAGTMTFEVFDAAGRRVWRSARAVTAGQSGIFETVQALPVGLYAYRVSLASVDGAAMASHGCIAIMR